MGVRVEPAAGPLALGCQGSVRDRLTPPGRVEGFRPREVYSIAALARWAPFRAPFFMPPLAAKTIQPPCGRGKCIPPLVPYGTTFPPRWEACHWILSCLRLLANPVPLPPQAVGLWVLSHGAMSLQESIETYSAPCIGGSPAQPG